MQRVSLMKDNIVIKGARENNLKGVDLTIPRDKLVVFTGVSGSGKTSLAFDTLFAEGQRRYVESLSSYARQFLGQMDKPDVEQIDGLSPAISIDQKTVNHNPRSTVGTVTEIYDYFRLLYARVGHVHCPECGKEISQQTVDEIVDKILALGEGRKVVIGAPVVRGRKGEYVKQLEGYKKSGFVRVRVDGQMYELEDDIPLEKNIKHDITVVVDRISVKSDLRTRITDSVETALKLADGLLELDNEGTLSILSTKYACPDCDISIEELTPRMFSFNSPFGACPVCSGLGFKSEIDPELIIGDRNKSLNEGAMKISGWSLADMGSMSEMYFNALSKKYKFDLDTPVRELDPKIIDILLYGTKGETLKMEYKSSSFSGNFERSFEGLANNLARRYRETSSEGMKAEIERYMKVSHCTACDGKRLKKEALSVRVGGKNIAEVCTMAVVNTQEYIEGLELSETEGMIAEQILKEIRARLRFLSDVGLSYLTLSRGAATLSGGETQRIRLATQIGSGLMGVLYILDEPSIGLHQHDNSKLLGTLLKLRDLGNTLIVVEHDEETIRAADHIVDIGPYAGEHGGRLVAQGSVQDLIDSPESVTGRYLSGERSIPVPKERRKPDGRSLQIIGATKNNLKNIDVKIPAGLMTAVTGVSGSGKSSLINQILYPVLSERLNGAHSRADGYERIDGIELFDKIIAIDQSPIGRTPRSNPATYTGMFTHIRDLFAKTPDAQQRGYGSGRFSFNVKGGRCENCSGDGIICIEMHFLPDVYVPCEVCGGKRYNRETLQVQYKGKNIYDILNMTVDEAMRFFENHTSIFSKVSALFDVGLGYIRLGQPATTLSGGEAQRVKLATELSKRSTTKTVYILDEPTTGLHMADVDKLITILQKLTSTGNTVIVIEHNLDVIKVADHIIDMGPEGGDRGGMIVAQGTPEEVAAVERSYTGQYLKKILL